MTAPVALPVPAGSGVLGILDDLAAALSGSATWLPVPLDDEREASRIQDAMAGHVLPTDQHTAFVVATSGTTGIPKGAMLSPLALHASIASTHARLGGPGRWLLALPPHHVAGLQVLLRSLVAGTTPEVLDVTRGFSTEAFAEATERMLAGPGPCYTSLVPGQVRKILEDARARAALIGLDAVLVGGAALPHSVRDAALAAGAPLVRTYGMSETCGGCVYDSIPLDGVKTRIDDGRIILGGATLAHGYLNAPGHPAFAEPGWFRTDDAGELNGGLLTVTGRLDEAITSGGLTVVPQVVERALGTHPAIAECAVVGIDDEQLGQRVAVAVLVRPGLPEPTLEQVRAHVAGQLGAHAAPRELHIVTALPHRGPGKIDRRALREQLAGESPQQTR
ncbi:o-succinylbenzoate--CoA ligase [Hoyosella sp. G463]|uniref:O-succinylbenzoate--CoA ligase n=1 Tax=Lolliginicoccus lacisalsi TaxID=2742202 RepID=A0A927PN73_9ACTN|nr:o-succinylbenzoate--CoA ligase [Lolliginicoccus lacisalsi]MBD8507336.1 o-succinylbenzoate--CoA ligase [Lolliginicoccus lacisalsi]